MVVATVVVGIVVTVFMPIAAGLAAEVKYPDSENAAPAVWFGSMIVLGIVMTVLIANGWRL